MKPDARSKLQFRSTINNTNQVRNPEEIKDVMVSGSSKTCPIMVSQWNQLGWNPSNVQSQQQLVYKGILLTPWFQEKVFKWWHLTCEPRINVGMSNKLLHRPGVTKLINLIPNHHTRNTRFNANHRFRVDCVIVWNQTWNRRPLPTIQGRWKDWVTLCQAPKAVCPTI